MTDVAGYRLGRLLGGGAFGQTYEATKSGERFAIKLIREEAMQQGFDLRRFQREVSSLQKAKGPHVVEFIEAGITPLGNETRYFVVLEYLDGNNLADHFKGAGQNYEVAQLKSILCQVLLGLETVHAKNIVHRDLKPANIFVTVDGTVKLLDFGLVKMLDYTTLTTQPGQAIGTPMYIAPEILRGDDVDWRADFYSFGVLIYHLVTGGKYPFEARSPLELYARVVNNSPISPTNHCRNLSHELENFILELLAKQPYQRNFQHKELREAITRMRFTALSLGESTVRARNRVFPKQCFFRLLQTEATVVQEFLRGGRDIDGFEFPANLLPRYQKGLTALKNLGLRFQFDPVTYRLQYSSFAQTDGLVQLPYVRNKDSILTPESLQPLDEQKWYVKACIDWQIKWGCSNLVAPFHFCRDLGFQWIDIDVKLIDESTEYAKSLSARQPLFAGLCFSIETYTAEANRLALLNRYSRAKASGYMLYGDSIDERNTNPLHLRSFLDLLKLFQRLGKPVFACRVGTLGLGLLAAGVDGMTSGIASLSSFSESNLLVNRAKGYDMSQKYYLPRLMLTLPIPMVEDILQHRGNSDLKCSCRDCDGRSRELGRVSKPHFLEVRTGEIAHLNSLPNTQDRIAWFRGRVEDALELCKRIRQQGKVDLKPEAFAHLRTWLAVFDHTV
jgi:eukaryotic-like serine/threonine-protein kinase